MVQSQGHRAALGGWPTAAPVACILRQLPAGRAVSAAPPGRGKPKPPWEPKTPRVVELLRKALDWLIPFATGREPWRHKQIRKLHPASLFPLLRRAATAYAEPRYEALIGKLQGADTRADRTNLLYPNPQR